MSTPGYPAGGTDPHAAGQNPYAPEAAGNGQPAGAPPVPGAPGGAAAPQTPGGQQPRPGAYVPQTGDLFEGDAFGGQQQPHRGGHASEARPGHEQRPFAAYAQVPVDPYALAAAAPLGTYDDPHAPRPAAPGRPTAPAAGHGEQALAAQHQPGGPAEQPAAGPVQPGAPVAVPAGGYGQPGVAGRPIDYVPGITQDPPERPAEQSATAPPEPVPSESAVVEPPASADPASSGLASSNPSQADPGFVETVADAEGAPVGAELVWDDGATQQLTGRVIVGRNPGTEGDATVAAVRDETLSLSKTHFDVEIDDAGAWLTDRHSTNGVTIVRGGERIAAVPGERTALLHGDALEMGDRIATFRRHA